MDALSDSVLSELLESESSSSSDSRYPPPVQTSRYVKFCDKEMRCSSRRCGVSTHIQVLGAPCCTTHVIHRLVDMLEDQINHFPNRPPNHERILQAYLELTDLPQNANTMYDRTVPEPSREELIKAYPEFLEEQPKRVLQL